MTSEFKLHGLDCLIWKAGNISKWDPEKNFNAKDFCVLKFVCVWKHISGCILDKWSLTTDVTIVSKQSQSTVFANQNTCANCSTVYIWTREKKPHEPLEVITNLRGSKTNVIEVLRNTEQTRSLFFLHGALYKSASYFTKNQVLQK